MSEGGVQRRLSAILAADVAGYTRLVENDRDGTVAAWRAARGDVIDPAIADHSGNIVKHTGDGFLAEFPTVQDAVQCAIDMQARLTGSPLEFRMGVGLGDIVDDGEDIHGEGVNIAARIEALADPGGIRVSSMVFEAVHNQIDAAFEDMGEHTVKNVSHPVRVYRVLPPGKQTAEEGPTRKLSLRLIAAAAGLVVLLGGVLAWWQMRPDFEPVEPASMALELPDKPSIAVLPFSYFGEGKSENEFIADGLSEQITSVLADVPELFVIARNSSFTYKGKAVDVREVSKRFGVRYVLEGSVQKSGDKLRVTTQLIDAVAGNHIWAATFDRSYSDLFKIQDEITVAVAQKIHQGAIRGNQLANRPTNSIEAWSEKIKGLREIRKFTAQGEKRARQHFARAIELDPEYAEPHHLTAFAHIEDVRFGFSSNPAKSFELAEQSLAKALAIEPENAEALGIVAFLRFVQKRVPEAIELARQAHERAPNQPAVAFALGWILLNSGDAEDAIPYYTKIKRLAPVPSFAVLNGDLLAHINSGRFEEAKKLVPNYLARSPDAMRSINLVVSALPFYQTKELNKAKSMVEEALTLQPDLSIASFHKFDLAYVDKSIPEAQYLIYRELGVPDLPPAERADPAKMKYSLPEKPSVAVLPFNFFGEKAHDYLSDGLTEHITAVLASSPELFVIARNSAFTYKNKAVKVQDVAQDLGVRYVLEGSVQRSDDKLRITAQLIDAIDGRHIWAKTFDRPTKDFFDIQDEISAEILIALHVKLTAGEAARSIWSDIKNLEVLHLLVRANRLFVQFTSENHLEMERLTREAYRRYPDLAGTNSMMAYMYRQKVQYGESKNPTADIASAREHAERALAVDPKHTSAMKLLAQLAMFAGKYETAITLADKALEIEPSNGLNVGIAAYVKLWSGQTREALPLIERAMRLDPLAGVWLPMNAGVAYSQTGDYNRANEIFSNVVANTPTELKFHHDSLAFLAAHAVFAGDQAKGRTYLAKLRAIKPDFSISELKKGSEAFKDKAYLGSIWAALRQAGMPDLPPSLRAEASKPNDTPPNKPSIAVLPFDNLSKDEGEDYFVDGITEDIITDLSQISGLLVIARNSTFTYKGQPVKVQDVGRELGADYVLEGSVRRVSNRVRINAQLVSTRDGHHLWAQRYDRDLIDVFALQDDVTGNIVSALAVKLTGDEQARRAKPRQVNPEAYDSLLRGLDQLRRFTPETNLRARQYFERAAAIDPTYARAHANVAFTYVNEIIVGWVSDRAETLKLAQKHNLDALALDPTVRQVHQSQSVISLWLKEHEKAAESARTAISLDPNYADAYAQLAAVLSYSRVADNSLSKALQAISTAKRLNPYYSFFYLLQEGRAYFQLRQYEQAAERFEQIIERNPHFLLGRIYLAATYAHLGRTDDADWEVQEVLTLSPEISLAFEEARAPYQDPADLRHFVDGLRKAGLPE